MSPAPAPAPVSNDAAPAPVTTGDPVPAAPVMTDATLSETTTTNISMEDGNGRAIG